MNIIDISNKFPEEIDAIKHFEMNRWVKGKPVCAYCKKDKISKRTKDKRFKCYSCKKTFSVTTKTFLHGTGTDLTKWLYAFSIVTDAKKGLSALQLHRNIDVSYPTAWKMYHTIRDIMEVENNNIELDGVIEMDETYIGGKPRKARRNSPPVGDIKYYDTKLERLGKRFEIKEGTYKKPYLIDKPKRGRGTLKIPVVGIVEREGDVIAEVMRHTTHENIKQMVKKYVDEKESLLITDDYKSYKRINKIIEHVSIDHQKMFSYKGINTNSIESFWAIVKRQIHSSHHHVSPKYLPKYVSELVFKYNNRKSDDAFETLVKNSMLNK